VIRNFFSNFIIIIFIISCSKEKAEVVETPKSSAYEIYKEGLDAWGKNDFFFASKKFTEAELLFQDPKESAKSAVMAAYSFYAINFFDESLEVISNFLKIYPADKHVQYVQYLKAIIYFEQIEDEKKDIAPLLKANKQIDFFIKNFPNSDYSIDLKFKKDLIRNQLAAKEVFVAKYYMQTQKWIPAINRLKIVINEYDDTVFVEEALHRLVEIHFHLGLEKEAKKYASILGYNYNSSEWFQQSYKILNKNYVITKSNNQISKKNKKTILKRIIEIIR